MFNEIKTTALSVEFLKLNDGQMNSIKLIKLLYLVDREFLLKENRRITYDELINMRCGVVLSNTLNRIKAKNDENFYWKEYIATENYDVFLIDKNKKTFTTFSKKESSVILKLDRKFKNYDYNRMIWYIHQFSEWAMPANVKASHTGLNKIIYALKKNKGDIAEILLRESINNTSYQVF